MLKRRYCLAPGARLEAQSVRYLLRTDYPLRLTELNESAWRLLGALDDRVDLTDAVEPVTQALVGFLEGLTAEGALTCTYEAVSPAKSPLVRVVVPVFQNPGGLARCLTALAEQDYPAERFHVVVVDDGSPAAWQPFPHTPPELSGRLLSLRLEQNAGAATARNLGAGAGFLGRPDLLAFTDSDCLPAAGWLSALAAVMDDRWVDAVGGRVSGLRRDTLLARYEHACSSLYMGTRPGAAGMIGSRIPYLPACNLMVSWEAFQAVGGFRPGLRLGEDVDLCWRLTVAGHGLFYHPPGEVFHAYRVRWGPFLRRKADYGFSEVWLRATHPRAFPAPANRAAGVGVILCAVALLWGYHSMAPVALVLPWVAQGYRQWTFLGRMKELPWRVWAAALARGGAGRMFLESRLLVRNTLVVWPLGLAVIAWLFGLFGALRLLPLVALLLPMALVGEWRARRPACTPLDFLLGFAGECLAYSLGKLVGSSWGWWNRVRGRKEGTNPPSEG